MWQFQPIQLEMHWLSQLNGLSKLVFCTFAQPMIVSKSGFPSETHVVTTSDGYILEVHRIPHAPKNANSSATRPVVFLQHGLLSSSADWVLEGTEKGLGMLHHDAIFILHSIQHAFPFEIKVSMTRMSPDRQAPAQTYCCPTILSLVILLFLKPST